MFSIESVQECDEGVQHFPASVNPAIISPSQNQLVRLQAGVQWVLRAPRCWVALGESQQIRQLSRSCRSTGARGLTSHTLLLHRLQKWTQKSSGDLNMELIASKAGLESGKVRLPAPFLRCAPREGPLQRKACPCACHLR